MRIVGGRWRGRSLKGPSSDAIRPTSDRLRETIFNILQHGYDDPVEGARVLDLFAGSGALGIEALSRGARSAVFVDRSHKAITAIRANLTALGIEAEVRPIEARAALRAASARHEAYDLVFLDPPYRRAGELGRELSEGLTTVLAPGGRVVTESDRRAPLELDMPLADERRYGDTVIRIHAT